MTKKISNESLEFPFIVIMLKSGISQCKLIENKLQVKCIYATCWLFLAICSNLIIV